MGNLDPTSSHNTFDRHWLVEIFYTVRTARTHQKRASGKAEYYYEYNMAMFWANENE